MKTASFFVFRNARFWNEEFYFPQETMSMTNSQNLIKNLNLKQIVVDSRDQVPD